MQQYTDYELAANMCEKIKAAKKTINLSNLQAELCFCKQAASLNEELLVKLLHKYRMEELAKQLPNVEWSKTFYENGFLEMENCQAKIEKLTTHVERLTLQLKHKNATNIQILNQVKSALVGLQKESTKKRGKNYEF